MKTPDTPSEWTKYFDEVWQLSDWLSEYGTIYGRPNSGFDHMYNGYVDPAERNLPDLIVDFDEHDDVVACFFVDAEDLEQFTRELTANGRLADYSLPHKTHLTIQPTDSEDLVTPDGALIVTQFSPFGHLLADTLEFTNLDVNESLRNVADGREEDYLTFLIGNLFNKTLSDKKLTYRDAEDGFDPFNTYHGVLAGSPIGNKTRQLPTALVAPHPDKHDFWYSYWERYNDWY